MAELVFVGTGDAFGSGGRRNSALLVRERSGTLLLDCGPTTLSGLNALGVDPLEIDAVALTHFHGDHISGLPFLLLDYVYEHPRRKPLVILGPPGVEERVKRMNEVFEYTPEQSPHSGVEFREFTLGREVEVGDFRVLPYPAHHHPETCPHMLGLTTGRRSLFFTGDTGWHGELPDRVGDVDLLVSECVFVEERFEYHLSSERLRQEQPRFSCARTILTHLGREVLDNTERVPFDLAEDGRIVAF
jgi:ribonuclease BN (tRNA processing enzyme)